MMKGILLFLLAIVYAKALDDCERYGAVWDASLNKCMCPPGFKGNPDLCCYNPNDNKACIVSGDPVMTTYHGQRVPFEFPCGTTISSHGSNQCRLVVYAGSREMKHGAVFYTSKVMVLFERVQGTNIHRAELLFSPRTADNGPRVHYKRPNGYRYSKSMPNPHSVRPFSLQGVTGTPAKVTWWAESNLLKVEGCGGMVNIRLVDNTEVIQDRVPGVCILIRPKQSYSGGLSCGYRTSKMAAVAKPMESWTYPSTYHRKATDGTYLERCNTFNRVVSSCGGYLKRLRVEKKCAFFLGNPIIKTCFSELNKPSDRAFINFDNLIQCFKIFCTGQAKACEDFATRPDVQKCTPSMTKCLK